MKNLSVTTFVRKLLVGCFLMQLAPSVAHAANSQTITIYCDPVPTPALITSNGGILQPLNAGDTLILTLVKTAIGPDYGCVLVAEDDRFNTKTKFIDFFTSSPPLTFGAYSILPNQQSAPLVSPTTVGATETWILTAKSLPGMTGLTMYSESGAGYNYIGPVTLLGAPLLSQTITFGTAPSVVVGGTGTVTATGGASGNAVTFTSTTPSVCTVSGSTVTGVAAGTCTVAANQAGNSQYSAATEATQDVTIGKGNQSLTFGNPPTVRVGGTGLVTATGGASGNTVTYTSTTLSVCTVSGQTVTGVSTGTCTIAADQAGNSNYNAAVQATQDIIVGKGTQSGLTATATPTNIRVNGTSVLAVSGESGNGAVTYAVTSGTCTINGNVLTGTGIGSCLVTATKAADSNYDSGTATVTVQVTAVELTGNVGGLVKAKIASPCEFTEASFAVPGTPPPGKNFPHGVFQFKAAACGVGGTAVVTLEYPQVLPPGTEYWKYINSQWVNWTGNVTITGNKVVLTLTDGVYGDTDGVANGEISDPSGPSFTASVTPASIPTLSQWGMIFLACLIGVFAFTQMRRRSFQSH